MKLKIYFQVILQIFTGHHTGYVLSLRQMHLSSLRCLYLTAAATLEMQLLPQLEATLA